MKTIEEYKTYLGALDGHIEGLQAYAKLSAENEQLHFCPYIRAPKEVRAGEPARLVIEILNPAPKEGSTGRDEMSAVPATFFYEAFRQSLPDIFARAIKLAEDSRSLELEHLREANEARKAALAAESDEIAALEKTLSKKKAS